MSCMPFRLLFGRRCGKFPDSGAQLRNPGAGAARSGRPPSGSGAQRRFRRRFRRPAAAGAAGSGSLPEG